MRMRDFLVMMGRPTSTIASPAPVSVPIIDIDHETGDLSQYTSSVTDSGDLSVAAGAALAGTSYGLSCLIDDTTAIYGESNLATPSTTGTVRVRFYIDPNGLTMGEGDNFDILGLYTSAPAGFGGMRLHYTAATGYRLRAHYINDTPTTIYGSYFNITDAPHYVELLYVRATSADANDASIQLWIDGVDKETLTGDMYTRFGNFDFVRIGAISGIDAGTSGTFYLDELVVNDDGTEIGPV